MRQVFTLLYKGERKNAHQYVSPHIMATELFFTHACHCFMLLLFFNVFGLTEISSVLKDNVYTIFPISHLRACLPSSTHIYPSVRLFVYNLHSTLFFPPRRYFKRISIPDMTDNKLKLQASSLSHMWANNTLIVTVRPTDDGT